MPAPLPTFDDLLTAAARIAPHALVTPVLRSRALDAMTDAQLHFKAEHLQRVFERFYSLPRPDGGSRSSGLGLPFVAQVAVLHGGHAELLEREGGGSVARLILRNA